MSEIKENNKRTIKHFMFCAKNESGNLVYIDDVPNGKKCGCYCAECGEALIAKQGKLKVHHFAHANGNDNIKCSQTALHLMAKEIIAEEKSVPIQRNGKIEFITVDFVEKEKNLGDIIPDLYFECEGKKFAIEIYVSHAVDDNKFNKIQNHNLTTFEIKLFGSFESRNDVKNAIYNLENIELIYDYDVFQFFIQSKKQILLQNGEIKNIKNGVVAQCPMLSVQYCGHIINFRNIQYIFCKQCFLGCKHDSNEAIYCLGNRVDELPGWFCRANVNENRFMSIKETEEKIKNFKQRIRNYVV